MFRVQVYEWENEAVWTCIEMAWTSALLRQLYFSARHFPVSNLFLCQIGKKPASLALYRQAPKVAPIRPKFSGQLQFQKKRKIYFAFMFLLSRAVNL
jgi:hypothetical protein